MSESRQVVVVVVVVLSSSLLSNPFLLSHNRQLCVYLCVYVRVCFLIDCELICSVCVVFQTSAGEASVQQSARRPAEVVFLVSQPPTNFIFFLVDCFAFFFFFLSVAYQTSAGDASVEQSVRRLLSSATLINQAVGDALSDLLFCEAVLRLKGWSCKVRCKNVPQLTSCHDPQRACRCVVGILGGRCLFCLLLPLLYHVAVVSCLIVTCCFSGVGRVKESLLSRIWPRMSDKVVSSFRTLATARTPKAPHTMTWPLALL